MAASVRITVIGPLTVAVGGRPIELAGFRRRALVARLTVGLGVPVSADDLADDLWEDDPAHRSTATLRTYISKLRSLLGEGGAALVSSSAGYCFDPDLVTLDAAELPAAHAADPATLREVLEGSRGAPYEGLDHLTWARTAAQRIDGWRLAAEERLAELDLAGGRADLVAHRAAPLTERHPYAERLHALVATALYTAGRQHDALAVLRRLRERLRDDLGLDPTPAAADLEHRILHHAVDVPGDATRVLPPPLRPRPGDPALVGRRSELAAIDAAREHLDRTGARVVLVTGDAGIGKTRLAAEAAERALADGALVLYGRCDEHVAVALQPFREALHGLRDTLDTPELATVLPEVEREDSAIGQGEEGRSRAATHGAATVLAASLAELADRRPVVLVLDDLQWATPSTIATVRPLLRHGRDRAVLVLALSRPDPGSQIDMLVAELRRERALDVVPLDGLPVEDVAVLLDREEASDVDPTDARDATGGNPYLLAELARHHRDGGTGIPGSVTAVLAPVIAALDADTRAVLETAALLGVVPDLDTLSVVHGIDGEALATHLERAAATRLLLPGPTGGYMFAHALARDVVDAGIGPARRPHRHAQIAAALVATHGDTRPDDVAAHFRLAGARHTADAATWLARAGEAALARHAYEDGEIPWPRPSASPARWTTARVGRHCCSWPRPDRGSATPPGHARHSTRRHRSRGASATPPPSRGPRSGRCRVGAAPRRGWPTTAAAPCCARPTGRRQRSPSHSGSA